MATKKPQPRSLKWDAAARLLTITVGKLTEVYKVAEVRSEDGADVLGYRLLKRDGQSYDVQPAHGECECLGYLRWNRPCKHILAVYKLQDLKHI